MANVLIRDLPEDLHAYLKRRARRNRRSLSKELLVLIELALEGGAPPEELPEPIDLGIALTADFVDAAKREGRA